MSSRSNARPPKASCTACGSRWQPSTIRPTATRRSSAFRTPSPSACCAAMRDSSTTRKRSWTTRRCARSPPRFATSSIPTILIRVKFTGHVRVTLASGEVREASQDHFRGGRDEPMSAKALEAKFIANCIYGGWDTERAQQRARHAARAARHARDRPHRTARLGDTWMTLRSRTGSHWSPAPDATSGAPSRSRSPTPAPGSR